MAIVLSTYTANSQTSVNSPYSRFGLGEAQYFGNASGFAQGQMFASFLDTNALNFGNPASYSFISKNRPIFGLGLSGRFTNISSSTETTGTNTFGLRHIALGFRMSKRLGGAFGVAPFSAQGYAIGNTTFDSDGNEITYQYAGEGGLNNLFIGMSYLLINQRDHKFSIGLNGSLLFGTLSKTRRVEFSEIGFLNTLVESSARISDFSVDLGWGYKGRINSNSLISIGGTFGLGNDLNTTRNEFAANYTYLSTGVETIRDTIEVITDSEGYIRLPKRISYGISYETYTGKANESDPIHGMLKLSAQYKQTSWSDYQEVFDGDTLNDNLNNSNSIAFGIEYQPLTKPFGDKTAYYKLVRYRAGIHTSQSFLNIDDTPISNYGISFGLGLPLLNTRSTSSLNFGFEVGQRGTTDNNLLQENYFGMFVGLTLSPGSNNKWFVKRKYD